MWSETPGSEVMGRPGHSAKINMNTSPDAIEYITWVWQFICRFVIPAVLVIAAGLVINNIPRR
jgi:hypothetical protein